MSLNKVNCRCEYEETLILYAHTVRIHYACINLYNYGCLCLRIYSHRFVACDVINFTVR